MDGAHTMGVPRAIRRMPAGTRQPGSRTGGTSPSPMMTVTGAEPCSSAMPAPRAKRIHTRVGAIKSRSLCGPVLHDLGVWTCLPRPLDLPAPSSHPALLVLRL